MKKSSHLREVGEAELAVFKKKLKALEKYHGRGTELISQYIPPGADRGSVMGTLSEEVGQSSNIKSPQTRKSVQGALRKIINFLKQIDFRLPANGLVVFAGNVSESEGKTDIRLFTVKPVKPLNTKLYWCDSEFHLAPLQEMVKPTEVYALVTIDKNEATIAVLAGKKYEVLGHFTSGVPGKIRAGGQCLLKDSLVQTAEGEVVRVDSVHNPVDVEGADLVEKTVVSTPVLDKWNVVKEDAVKIVTKYPKTELTCSLDHVVFTWDKKKNAIRTVPAEELTEESVLLMPESIPFKGVMQRLASSYYNYYRINAAGLKELKNRRKEKGWSQNELAKRLGFFQGAVSNLERDAAAVSRKYLNRFCQSLGLDTDNFLRMYGKPQDKATIPPTLDPDLAQVLGYLAGDGSLEKERISFFEQREEVAKKYEQLCKEIFKANSSLRYRESKNYWELRVQGKAIVRMIEKEFPELKKACNSTVPAKIMKSPGRVALRFLRGFMDAEGYVGDGRVAVGINNKVFCQQLQLLLLRFGILSSLNEYDSRCNPYSNRHRFTVEISEKESLERYSAWIGFSSTEKRNKVQALLKQKSDKSLMRQVLISGTEVRRKFEAAGLNTQYFPKVSNFFRNERNMSKNAFRASIVENVTGKPELAEELRDVLRGQLLPVGIRSLQRIKGRFEMVDISTGQQNFLANGLLVHNSAQRFEHIREEAALEFYKRISEKLNAVFVPYGDKLKGVIVGGPGMTKQFFLERDLIDHRLKAKIIGQVDTSYTDESGIREVVQRSEDLLRDTDLMRERALMQKFFGELAKDNLAVYGRKEVEEALSMGKVDKVLVSEGLEWLVVRYKCRNSDEVKEFVVKEPASFKEQDLPCETGLEEVLEETDYADHILEKAQGMGSEVRLVSTDTPEGEQFFVGFGGIGALLRYK